MHHSHMVTMYCHSNSIMRLTTTSYGIHCNEYSYMISRVTCVLLYDAYMLFIEDMIIRGNVLFAVVLRQDIEQNI